jgi:hypothetical protein
MNSFPREQINRKSWPKPLASGKKMWQNAEKLFINQNQ